MILSGHYAYFMSLLLDSICLTQYPAVLNKKKTIYLIQIVKMVGGGGTCL